MTDDRLQSKDKWEVLRELRYKGDEDHKHAIQCVDRIITSCSSLIFRCSMLDQQMRTYPEGSERARLLAEIEAVVASQQRLGLLETVEVRG